MKQHTTHRLPPGAFAAIIGTRPPPATSDQPPFVRHLLGEEAPIERRFRVPVTSVPAPAATRPLRASASGPGS